MVWTDLTDSQNWDRLDRLPKLGLTVQTPKIGTDLTDSQNWDCLNRLPKLGLT